MTPERIARLRQVLDRRQPDLTVVTDFVHKQRNLSAIVRNCDAVGVMDLHAVLGEDEYRSYRGTAMGSQRWVRVRRHGDVHAAVHPLLDSGYQVLAAHLDDSAVDFREVDYTLPTALLLGAEKQGVSAAGRALATRCITVPMVGMVESYNVSVATGIILAEAQRQRQLAGLYDRVRISEALYERLFFEWGHSSVRDFCRERALAYPPLNSEGEIDNPSAWYASVREGRAAKALTGEYDDE